MPSSHIKHLDSSVIIASETGYKRQSSLFLAFIFQLLRLLEKTEMSHDIDDLGEKIKSEVYANIHTHTDTPAHLHRGMCLLRRRTIERKL